MAKKKHGKEILLCMEKAERKRGGYDKNEKEGKKTENFFVDS